MNGTREEKVTYPDFIPLPSGDLLFLYRDGGSGNGVTVLKRYSLRSREWETVQPVLIDGEGERNAYTNGLAVDLNGVWHLTWCWRETGDVSTNHDLMYARSNDEGQTWENSRGEPITLPITQANAEVVREIPQGSTYINQTTMTTDIRGRPIVASYWKEEGDVAPQYRLVWYNGFEWRTAQVGERTLDFELSGGGTRRPAISRPMVLAVGSDKVLVFFRDRERGDVVSVAVSDEASHRSWEILDLTTASVGQWEPTADRLLWEKTREVHLFHQFVGQGAGETSEDIPPQTASVLTWRP
jgi:hypothetical protein